MKRQLSSVSDLLEVIKKETGPLIFRGQNQSWPLLPKIARRNVRSLGYGDWVSLEDDIISRFICDVSLLLGKEPKNKLDWLVLGQHYGLPTRLLDWTTNPLKALFFACDNNFSEDGLLYSLNYFSYYQHSENDYLILDNEGIQVYFPKINNDRMSLQEGCFTIFSLPRNADDLQDLVSSLSNDESTEIVEYYIASDEKRIILQELSDLGINNKFIFSGVEGICKKICFDLGY